MAKKVLFTMKNYDTQNCNLGDCKSITKVLHPKSHRIKVFALVATLCRLLIRMSRIRVPDFLIENTFNFVRYKP